MSDVPPAPARWRPSPSLLVVGAVGLLLSTAGLGVVPSRRDIGPDRVPDPSEAPAAWRLRGDGGGVAELLDGQLHLESRAGQRAVAWFDLGPVGGQQRWRAVAHLKAPRPAEVKLVVAATDGQRRLWMGSHRVESDTWTEVELPVHAPLQGLDVSVGLRLRGEAGEAWVDRIDLVPVEPRPLWSVGLVAVVLGWFVWWGLLVRRMGVLVGGLVLAIAAGVTVPRAWVDLVIGPLAGVRVLESSVALWMQKFGGHAGLFGLLGASVASRWSWRTSLGVVVGLALVSEGLQLVSIGRSASLSDVALDVVGGAMGVAAVMWWRARGGGG